VRTGAYVPDDEPDVPEDDGRPKLTLPGYEIIGELGRGGMGVVYKARQIALDRVVALKMVLAGANADSGNLARFQTEAQAVAALQHPNVVQIHEVGTVDGLPYFSLEFIDGGSLTEKISSEPQPPRFAAEVVELLARAMQAAHDRGIVHRDLKPANVLLARDGTPKVTDFGLAKRLEADSGQTRSGQVLGTPSYMAPEQATGDADKVGPSADVYALGAILYAILTGRPPFAGTSMLDTLHMVKTREPAAPSQLAASVPRDLETIALKCLQKDPGRRYASAAALADDLRRYLDGRPILARPVSAIERAWRWARRNPWVAGFWTTAAAALVTIAVVSTVLKGQADENAREANKARDEANTATNAAIVSRDQAMAARQDAEKARELTAGQRNESFEAIRLVLLRIDDQLRATPALAAMRERVIAEAMVALERVRDQAAKSQLASRDEMIGYQRLGDIYVTANRLRDAADLYDKAYVIAETLARETPKDPIHKRNLAAMTNKRADAQLRLGNGTTARDLYNTGLKLRQEWTTLDPNNNGAKQSVAQSHGIILGQVALQLGDPASALANLRAAETIYAALPANANIRLEQAAIQKLFGDAELRLGYAAEAEKHYRASLQGREAVLAQNPASPTVIRDVALSRLALGDFALISAKDPAKAWDEYMKAAEALTKLWQATPGFSARRDLSAAQYRLGVTAGRLPNPPGGAAVAARHLDECLKHRLELAKIDPKDTQSQFEVMLIQGRVGQQAEAEKKALALLAQAGKDPRVLFQAACGLALASDGSDKATADRCRDKAVQVVGDLIKSGWKDKVTLETDPDLDSIRADARFTTLVAAMPTPAVPDR
jgi:serine/threonine-protein kinase